MGMTTALQNALLDEYFGVERFMSLHSGDPGDAGSYAAEVSTSGTGYARQSLLGKVSAASDGYVTNTSTVTFPTIVAAYGSPITDFGVGSAVTAGTMGLRGFFTESSIKSTGQAYQFPPGTLRFKFR